MKAIYIVILILVSLGLTVNAQQPIGLARSGTDPAAREVEEEVATKQGLAAFDWQTSVPVIPVAEAITPDIQALARGLENDPVRIFNYVHDHIRHVLYFGSKKGAELTLLEKSGNDFDQCALLVALLRAAGYTNSSYNLGYQFGWMKLPYSSPDDNDLQHWLQLNLSNNNWNSVSNYLDTLIRITRGYPATAAIWGTNVFAFQRIWVTLTIGSTNYYLDPSFKVSEPIGGINLGRATKFDRLGLMSLAGGTDTGDYVKNLNEASVRNALTVYTTNLLYYIQTNCPNASVEQVLSGWQIAPSTRTTLSTTLPFATYNWGGWMPVLNWANEPTNLMSSFTMGFAGTNWFKRRMPELQGQRLTLIFDTNGLGKLWLEDSVVAQAQTGAVGYTDISIMVDHPVGGWDTNNNLFQSGTAYDQTNTVAYTNRNSTYDVVYAFEPDWGWLQKRQTQLNEYRQAFGDSSRQVVSETMNVMALTYALQSAECNEILAAQAGMLHQNHHLIGRLSQEAGSGYYFDIFMWRAGDYSSTSPTAGSDIDDYLSVGNYFGSALEHGVIEQLQPSNLVAASTVKMLQIASTNGQKIYLASSNNWQVAAHVRTNLVGYSSSALASFDDLISQGDTLLLPAVGTNRLAGPGSWAGYGYVDHNGPGSSGMMISGIYGGQVSIPSATVSTPYIVFFGNEQPPVGAINLNFTVADPVDAISGGFQVSRNELSVGQSEPRGLSLATYYNSTRRDVSLAGMSPGWTHNYCITAQPVAAPRASLGGTTPAQMASIVAATYAALGVYIDRRPDPETWTVTALIAKWAADQLNKRGVSVQMGKDMLQFVQQPNGALTPPANCTWTLTNSGTYILQQRHGNTFTFDSFGRLDTIADQYSFYTIPLQVTYNSSNWVSTVTDWKGRSLTFTYSGNPSRLTSVANDTGEFSVDYGYTGGDLTSVTDAENKTSRYGYDSDHQIITARNELNQLVTTNIYDPFGSGRVNTQRVQGDTNKTWQVYWSGWQTVVQDPAGGKQRYFFDDKSRPICFEDALGHRSQTSFDGQDHVIASVSPMNELYQYFYDGNHNLLFTVDPLGFSNRFEYDGQFNLVRAFDKRGKQSSFGYDGYFALTGSTNGAGDWVVYVYNTDGELYSKRDSAGTSIFTYDAYGQLKKITYPLGLGSESFVFNPLGELTSRTDGRGFTTAYSYNSRGQLTNTVGPTNLTSKITYDAVGNEETITDPRNFTKRSFWSPTRHLTGTVLPATPQGTPMTTNYYDSRDWLSRSLDTLQHPVLFTNDIAGRLLRITDPLMRSTCSGFDPNGRQIAITNDEQQVIGHKWNPRGELVVVTNPALHTIQRFYDAAGNLQWLTNRNGNWWQFEYDDANRLITTTTPLLRQTKQTWNNRGLLESVTNPMLQSTTFYYDARGRLTNRTDLAGVTGYSYDGNNNMTGMADAARGATLSWGYDAYNRPSAFTNADGLIIQYQYDLNGNLTNLTYPGGRWVGYAYDSLNRLTNVTDWASRKTTITYDLASHITSITRPNGTIRLMNYDVAGQLTNIVEKTLGGLPIAFFTLGWTNSGRAAWEFAGPLPHTYALAPKTMSFDADDRLSTFNGQSVTNDDNGNLTWGPLTNNTLTAYTYDARNRLQSAGGISYGYDPAGNRIAVTNGMNAARFIVNPNAALPQTLIRHKADGSETFYVYGLGLLYEVNFDSGGNEINTRTYHYDTRGSTVAITDGSGLPTDRVEYSPYGTTTYRVGTTDTPFLYNGRYGVMTDANGLLYMRARYYNPYLCRFINADPSGFSGGLNLYAYANGNPVSYLDPFGLGAGNWDAYSWLDYHGTWAAKSGYAWAYDQVHDLGATLTGFGLNLLGTGLDFVGGGFGNPYLGNDLNNLANDFYASRFGYAKAGWYDPKSPGIQLANYSLMFINPEGVEAELISTEESITLYHGTTSSAASKIVNGGFRESETFFAEETATSQYFAYEAAARNGALSTTTITFTMPRSVASNLGLLDRQIIGEQRNLLTPDIAGGSGFERILSSQNVSTFNALLENGTITARRLKH